MLAGKPATNRQPDRHEVVTHVSGTICYLCLRSGQCPTRVVGRTRTMFHNTLVVGSSPTSSTTQSPATGENDGTLPRGGRSPCRRRRSPCPPECISRPPFPSFQVAHLARASLSAVNEKTRLQSHTALAARALASRDQR